MYRPCLHCENGRYEKNYCPEICTYGEEKKRLAAYEDTGLMPEEIANQTANLDFLLDKNAGSINANRLRELVKADTEGRLVVLPCKVGDTVYVVFTNGIRPYVVDRINVISQNQIRVRMRFMVNETLYLTGDNIGKTVFLTREEAEAALKGGEGDA